MAVQLGPSEEAGANGLNEMESEYERRLRLAAGVSAQAPGGFGVLNAVESAADVNSRFCAGVCHVTSLSDSSVGGPGSSGTPAWEGDLSSSLEYDREEESRGGVAVNEGNS